MMMFELLYPVRLDGSDIWLQPGYKNSASPRRIPAIIHSHPLLACPYLKHEGQHMGTSSCAAYCAGESARIQRLRRLARFPTGMTQPSNIYTFTNTARSTTSFGRIHTLPKMMRRFSSHMAPQALAQRRPARKKRRISLGVRSPPQTHHPSKMRSNKHTKQSYCTDRNIYAVYLSYQRRYHRTARPPLRMPKPRKRRSLYARQTADGSCSRV
jgi:hypothetical protein